MTTQSPLGTAIWEADRHLDTEAALQDWQAAPAANLEVLETDREKLRILAHYCSVSPSYKMPWVCAWFRRRWRRCRSRLKTGP